MRTRQDINLEVFDSALIQLALHNESTGTAAWTYEGRGANPSGTLVSQWKQQI